MNNAALYLAQTDTTVGFLSKSQQIISIAKQRVSNKKPILITVATLEYLKQHTRIPSTFKKLIRNAQKCSFVYPNGKCLRVVHDKRHQSFLKRFGFLYSSSANITQQEFSASFAENTASIVVYENNTHFIPNAPSHIFKINTKSIKRIR